MTMVKTPQKIFYDINSKVLYDENGNTVRSEDQYPSISLTEKQTLNIQLVTDSDLTPYTNLPSVITGELHVDNDFNNPQLYRQFQVGAAWTKSLNGTDEYYYNRNLTEQPDNVFSNTTPLTSGTLGTLALGAWGYGDNDSIGADRTYLRLLDGSDPDAGTPGVLTYIYADTTSTPAFIYSDTFNVSGSWYDSTTSTMRNPNTTSGELTYDISANTENFYDRLTTDTSAISHGYSRTTAQLPIKDLNSDIFMLIEFGFICRNRYLNDGDFILDLAEIVVYTKDEVNTLLDEKIDLVLSAVVGNGVALNSDGSLYDVGFPILDTAQNTSDIDNIMSGNITLSGDKIFTGKITTESDSIQINTSMTPASASVSGITGQVAWDASYMYVCVATDTWKRSPITTW